jgi:hypothetical protein
MAPTAGLRSLQHVALREYPEENVAFDGRIAAEPELEGQPDVPRVLSRRQCGRPWRIAPDRVDGNLGRRHPRRHGMVASIDDIVLELGKRGGRA